MARLDIWLPVWNREATLAAALRSLHRQTFRDWRIIAVDDGSTDRTPEILDAAGIRSIRIPHGGIVKALLAAARASDAPLVARMDADDLCHRDRFAEQIALRADCVATRVKVTGPQGLRVYARWQNSLVSHDDIVSAMFIESPITNPSALFTRALYEGIGGYRDVTWPEDYDLWHRMREAGARFAKVPRVLVAWRDRPDRLTRTHPMYAEKAIRAAKLHFLLRHEFVKRGPLTVWGAGPIGKAWMRDLKAHGIAIDQAIDIDPRKLGRAVAGGVPVRSPEEALKHHGPILGAVGSRGARTLIRERLLRAGLAEGRDFLFVA